MALLSALLLTLQFAFMYAFPSVWNDLISGSYLASRLSGDQINILHEVA
jgi:hypothetical protein